MIPSFSEYLVEEQGTVFFTFGRMNPPTIGHGKLLDKLAQASGRAPYKVFLSQSHDAKKNPLTYNDKVKYVRKMFPKHARSIVLNNKVINALGAAVELHKQGFANIVMVVGSDRVREFETLLTKYNGKDARHGFYNFKSIKVISAGNRDPDAEGVEGMSASKQRSNAAENDYTAFSQGVPATMQDRDTRKLFNDIRKGMGLKEQQTFRNHVELASVSETRELYVAGQLFGVGDQVVITSTEQVATVEVLGSNYVIVECDGQRLRKWLQDVELVESNQPEWGTPESTAKAKKITPGQQKSQPEKDHRKGRNGFKNFTSEQTMDIARDRISREKERTKEKHKQDRDQLAKKHDTLLDRVRRQRTIRQNRGIKQ